MILPAIREKYEVVIGLEVHAQLRTESKAYNTDSTSFGEAPNENVGVITLAHPGALPKANKKVIEYAIKMGLACGCNITRYNFYDRKNYFYPDLPKAYQITQDRTPICVGGSVKIKLKSGVEKTIGLTRIHMEEDAGKSLHMAGAAESLIDLNRAGVPLIEIVSEPEMRSSEEAYVYLTEVHRLVKYLDICDGNMEEGSFRCDANVSVRLWGAAEFGKKVEVKNMNSFRNVLRAIDHEVERQIERTELGKEIDSETRMFDASTGSTYSLRSKESLNDYRYFPEPDLQPNVVTDAQLESIRAAMPALPAELFERFTTKFGLSEYDANVLVEDKDIALYFDALCQKVPQYKAASNWVMGPLKSLLNERAITLAEIEFAPEQMAEVIALVEGNKISFSQASQKLFPAFVDAKSGTAAALAADLNLLMDTNQDALREAIQAVVAANPEKVAEYRKGKKGLLGMFMGEVMKKSGGKANPKDATAMLTEMLEG